MSTVSLTEKEILERAGDSSPEWLIRQALKRATFGAMQTDGTFLIHHTGEMHGISVSLLLIAAAIKSGCINDLLVDK